MIPTIISVHVPVNVETNYAQITPCTSLIDNRSLLVAMVKMVLMLAMKSP